MTHTYYPPSVGPAPTGPTPTFKNDDYHADLDAENIYRLILTGKTFVEAANQYYPSLTSTNTRADVFATYISLTAVEQKIFALTAYSTVYQLKVNYPDTYNFICSFQTGLADMDDFTD